MQCKDHLLRDDTHPTMHSAQIILSMKRPRGSLLQNIVDHLSNERLHLLAYFWRCPMTNEAKQVETARSTV